MSSKETETEAFGASHCYASREHCDNIITLKSITDSMENFSGAIFMTWDSDEKNPKRGGINHRFKNGVLIGMSDYMSDDGGNFMSKLFRPTTKCGTSDVSSLETNIPTSSQPSFK